MQRFETYILDSAKSEKTAKGYLQDLKQFDSFLTKTGGSLDDLTRVDVQNYMKHLEKLNRSASTVARHFATIRKFCLFLGRPELTEGVHKVEKQSVTELAPKTLKKLELLRIFRIVERTKNLRTIAIFYLLAYTGMRVGELHSLDRSSVFLKRGGTVRVIGKGKKEREIPFPAQARNAVKDYLDTRNDDHPALFLSNKGGRLAVRTIQELIGKIEKQYNAEVSEEDQINLHAHLLRHGYATMLVKEKKYDLGTVADIMGHEDLKTTRRYAKDSLSDVGEELEDLVLF